MFYRKREKWNSKNAEISMFANNLPNSWVHSNSSRMSQIFTYKGNPMASIQIYHIYAVDSGLHNIKFIIYPIHSQILWVFNRNTENFSDTWTRDVNWKNLKEKPKLLNLLSITSWERFFFQDLSLVYKSVIWTKKKSLETFNFTSWVNRRWWGILLKSCEAYIKLSF